MRCDPRRFAEDGHVDVDDAPAALPRRGARHRAGRYATPRPSSACRSAGSAGRCRRRRWRRAGHRSARAGRHRRPSGLRARLRVGCARRTARRDPQPTADARRSQCRFGIRAVGCADSARSAMARSSAVVIFMLRSFPSTMATASPAHSAMAASSVKVAAPGCRCRPMGLEDGREGETLRRLRPPETSRGQGLRHAPGQSHASACRHRHRGTTARMVAQAPATTRSMHSVETNGRAASWISTAVWRRTCQRLQTHAGPIPAGSRHRGRQAAAGRETVQQPPRTSPASSGWITTGSASIRGWAAKTREAVPSIGTPPRWAYCFLATTRAAVARVPRPAATISAAMASQSGPLVVLISQIQALAGLAPCAIP